MAKKCKVVKWERERSAFNSPNFEERSLRGRKLRYKFATATAVCSVVGHGLSCADLTFAAFASAPSQRRAKFPA